MLLLGTTCTAPGGENEPPCGENLIRACNSPKRQWPASGSRAGSCRPVRRHRCTKRSERGPSQQYTCTKGSRAYSADRHGQQEMLAEDGRSLVTRERGQNFPGTKLPQLTATKGQRAASGVSRQEERRAISALPKVPLAEAHAHFAGAGLSPHRIPSQAYQNANVAADRPMMVNTKGPEIWSASRCTGASRDCASSTSRVMADKTLLAPVAEASTVRGPSWYKQDECVEM
jgi:hypothetical protein